MDPGTGGGYSMHNMESMKMSYEFLKTITKEFTEDRLLGSGAFGRVYKVWSTHLEGYTRYGSQHTSSRRSGLIDGSTL